MQCKSFRLACLVPSVAGLAVPETVAGETELGVRLQGGEGII